MTLLQAYLTSSRVQRALKTTPHSSGFTLIELVIVVAILAILAAIGIPAFNDAQVRAREASAKTGLATAYKECKVSALLGTAEHTELKDGGGVDFSNQVISNGKGACTVTNLTGAASGGSTYQINLTNGDKTGGAAW